MNAKNKIAAILIAAIIGATVMAMSVPAVMGDSDPEATTTVSVGNVPPFVCCKWEEPDDDLGTDGTQVMPEQCNNTKAVTIKACVCDGNGNDDISSVSAKVYYPNDTLKTTVTLVSDSSVDCSGCTCEYTGVDCVGYSGTVDMGCCDPAGWYTVVVIVTDQEGEANGEENAFEYLSLIAMTASDVNFGSVAPGGSSTANSTITVYGNDAIKFVDADPAGYDDPDPGDGIVWSNMTSREGNTIADDQITTTWDPATCIDGCLGTADVSFTLNVPAGTQPGSYVGTITFTPSECPPS